MRTILAIGKNDAFYYSRKRYIGQKVEKINRYYQNHSGSFIEGDVYFKDKTVSNGMECIYFRKIKLSKEKK